MSASLAGLKEEDKLKILLRPSIPEAERTAKVDIVMVTLPLSKKAQLQPMTAWKQTMKAMTGHEPLLVSLVHPCRAEVYLDSKVSDQVKETLQARGYLQDSMYEPDDRDLARRKVAYLNGYFKLLRQAAFEGLTPNQQLELLDRAQKDLTPARYPSALTRKQMLFQIRRDREEIEISVKASMEI